MDLRIKGTVVTSAGNIRSGNEDNYYLFGNYRYDTSVNSLREEKESLAGQSLAAVYDGMGGEESGELASLTAARYFMPCKWEKMQEEVLAQVKCANGELCREIRKRDGSRIGTTAVMLYMDAGKAVCCNIGDSRCYLMRDGILRQLSVDHSEAENMLRMGVLDPAQARQSKSWHKLTQHLGIFPEEFVIEPHFSDPITLQEQDRFLLCSDGLTDMVLDDEIAKVLGDAANAGSAADALVKSALQHGGRDNVTVMVLEVSDASMRQKSRKSAKSLLLRLLAILVAVCIGIGIGIRIEMARAGRNADQQTDTVGEEEPEAETLPGTTGEGESDSF